MEKGKIKSLFLAFTALFLSAVKRFIYRFFFGYKIGKNVKIGF